MSSKVDAVVSSGYSARLSNIYLMSNIYGRIPVDLYHAILGASATYSACRQTNTVMPVFRIPMSDENVALSSFPYAGYAPAIILSSMAQFDSGCEP